MSKLKNINSIKDALNTLNRAALDKAEDVQSVVESNYTDLKKVVGNIKPKVKRTADNVSRKIDSLNDDIYDTAYDMKRSIERTTKKDPIKTLGIVSVGAFILGYLVKSNNNK